MVRSLDLRLQIAGWTAESDLGQAAHAHLPLSPSSIIGTSRCGDSPTLYRKVTVGLASHRSCVTDFVFYTKLWSQKAEGRRMNSEHPSLKARTD